MGKKELKTNAMRILDKNKIPYEYQTYDCAVFIDGITAADKAGLPRAHVYKTLVTTGKSGEYYVFVIPDRSGIRLKKSGAYSKGKGIGNASGKTIARCDRLYKGRVHCNRDEKTIFYGDRHHRPKAGIFVRQRWKTRHADKAASG